MSVESAIFAHAADLAVPLFIRAVGWDAAMERLKAASGDYRRLVHHCIRRAEAVALISLCDETLWNDCGLLPALREDLDGPKLVSVARLVLRSDAENVREIRGRALRENELASNTLPSENDLALAAEEIEHGNFQEAATVKYLVALEAWLAPVTIPDALKRRIERAWLSRFCAAVRSILKSDPDAANTFGAIEAKLPAEERAEQKRLDEIQRQSWRLDEVLARLDKWVRANPGAVPAKSKGATAGGTRKMSSLVIAVAILAVLGAVAGTSWWMASSDSAENLIARAQAPKLHGLPERLSRAVAWLGSEPIPADVFTAGSSLLQDSTATEPTTDDALNRAFAELQQKRIVRATLSGWIFNSVVREKFSKWNSQGEDWWNRSAAMAIKAAPEEGDADAVERWRNLLPHLVALFESGKGKPELQETFQPLLQTIAEGLLATRMEPGRTPSLATEPEALTRTLANFVDSARKYLEGESKNLEVKYGRFSPQMVTVHLLVTELSWRTGELKKEQDSLVRAIRTLEKIEPRDFSQIASLNLRYGMSRAVSGDVDGAEESFNAALQALRDRHGDLHPEITRMQRQIARTYAGLGQFKLAGSYYANSLEGAIKVFPVPTPETAAIYEEQGQYLLDYGQFKAAITAMQKGIELLQKIEYATSPRLAQAYRSLANAQVLAGEPDDAEKSARKAVDLLSAEYGADASEVSEPEVDLVSILLDVADPTHAEEAGKLLERRITVPLNAPFPDDSETASLRACYARSLQLRGNAVEAVAQFQRAIGVLLETKQRPSVAVAVSLRDFGQALADSGRRSEAVKRLASAEAEVIEINKSHPRYTRLASRLLDDIHSREGKLK